MSVNFTRTAPGGASVVRLVSEVADELNAIEANLCESGFPGETPLRWVLSRAIDSGEEALVDARIAAHVGGTPQSYLTCSGSRCADETGVDPNTGDLTNDSWAWYRTGTTFVFQRKASGAWVDVVRFRAGGLAPQYWDGAAWVTVAASGVVAAHDTSHENGGSDEISVAGLSGLLADPQTPLTHSHATSDVTGLDAALAGKVGTARAISTTAPISGGGDLSADRTIALDDNGVTFAKMQDIGQDRIVGRITGGAGDPESLTGTQVTAMLDAFTSVLKGLAPPSGGGTTNFLRADGSWAAPPGGSGGGSATTVEKDLGSTPDFRGKFTITDAAIGPTNKVLCWQAPGPYTGKGTRADEAEMQPVTVIAVEPASGSAVVKWQTPPMFAVLPDLQYGSKLNATGATFDRSDNQQRAEVGTPRRIGRVRGSVKFSYMVLS